MRSSGIGPESIPDAARWKGIILPLNYGRSNIVSGTSFKLFSSGAGPPVRFIFSGYNIKCSVVILQMS